MHKHSKGAIKDLRVYKFCKPTVHVNGNFRLYKLITCILHMHNSLSDKLDDT